jgi:MoxR-like ATPase
MELPAEGAGPTGRAPKEPGATARKQDPAKVLEQLPTKAKRLRTEIESVIFGQSAAVDAVLWALLARGHVLLVGLPGLAKTLLVRALARVLHLSFRRIQFTPDLMPADITGTMILRVDPTTQKRSLSFAPGPVFTQMLLADEINRAPPKTQAALLEAMQEKTVTVAGRTHELEEPFVVLATQNPIEQEGTYPLPEAQLDRFLLQLNIEYPSLEDERRVVAEHSYYPLERLKVQLSREEILTFREAVAGIPAAPEVIDYAVRLVRATRPQEPTAPSYVRDWVRWGTSPRASQNLLLAGRARAACQGRFHVACDDIAAVARPVLRHRLIRTFRAEADGKSTDDIIGRLIDEVPRYSS